MLVMSVTLRVPVGGVGRGVVLLGVEFEADGSGVAPDISGCAAVG